jgi:hypothetical protein
VSKELLERLTRTSPCGSGDPDFIGKPREAYPISIHYGEGINPTFHATLHTGPPTCL